MKKIGLVTNCQIAKARAILDFADEIISIENVGTKDVRPNTKIKHDRIKVIYKIGGIVQSSTFSGQSHTVYKKRAK